MRTRQRIPILAALALCLITTAEAQERPAPARGWLGILYHVSEEKGPDAGSRVIVEEVHPASPAERAGLRAGDEIVRWNGRTDVVAVMKRAPALQPGDTVRVRVRRGSERDRDLVVVAGERPRHLAMGHPRGKDVIVIAPGRIEHRLRLYADSMMLHADSLHLRLRRMLEDSLGPRLRELERELPRLRIFEEGGVHAPGRGPVPFDLGHRSVAGAELAEMNPGLSTYFGTERGVLVLRVASGSPAHRAGLRAGDVVLQAADGEVERVSDLRRALTRAQARRAREVELEVLREGKHRELTLRWE